MLFFKVLRKIKAVFTARLKPVDCVHDYIVKGRIPWSTGYNEYKWQQITRSLLDSDLLLQWKNAIPFHQYGKGIDERIVEYPWIFANLQPSATTLLDAGSTFNFKDIVEHSLLSIKKLSILTFYPEYHCYYEKAISYVYNDLRDLPFKDVLFDEIVCQSTLEHIAMDNSMYGYTTEGSTTIVEKNYEYLTVITELNRVLKDGGVLLLTVPYGIFENHGFFQQFDAEMIARITKQLEKNGIVHMSYFKYELEGWKSSNEEECDDAYSFNPHTGKGKGVDGAAHSRAICCLKFTKKGA